MAVIANKTRNIKFGTEENVASWYMNLERFLSPSLLEEINSRWHEATCNINEKFLRVIRYMRDIEWLTKDRFAPDLRKSPSGRDRLLKQFLIKWTEEETTHGDLLDEYLRLSGHGFTEYKNSPRTGREKIRDKIFLAIEYIFYKHFKALHMVWGLISELTTRLGYEILAKNSKNDPFLKELICNIIREENVHTTFYREMARLKLEKSRFSRLFCRIAIRWLWYPVGAGERDMFDVMPLIEEFKEPETLKDFEQFVAAKVRQLPGFERFDLTALFIKHIQKIPTI